VHCVILYIGCWRGGAGRSMGGSRSVRQRAQVATIVAASEMYNFLWESFDPAAIAQI
jgi:hypothetical protein